MAELEKEYTYVFSAAVNTLSPLYDDPYLGILSNNTVLRTASISIDNHAEELVSKLCSLIHYLVFEPTKTHVTFELVKDMLRELLRDKLVTQPSAFATIVRDAITQVQDIPYSTGAEIQSVELKIPVPKERAVAKVNKFLGFMEGLECEI